MSELWKRMYAEKHGQYLSLDHEPKNPITEHIIEAILRHATSPMLTQSQGQEYRVLDAGCSPEASLSFLIGRYAEALRTKKGIRVPPFKITGLDISPPSIRPEGYEYKVGDVHRLEFPDHYFHSAVASTIFEYLDDKDRAADELNRVIKPEGLLYVVFHAGDTDVPVRFKKVAQYGPHVFGAMRDYFLGKATRSDALDAIRFYGMHTFFSFKTPEAMLAEYDRNPDQQEAVDRMLKKNVFRIHLALAEQLQRGRFQTMKDALDFLERHGFEAEKGHNPYQYLDSKFWLVKAKKFRELYG